MTTTPQTKNKREKINPAWLAINWNNADQEDTLSNTVWKKLVENFWVPEKIPVSNDIPTWEKLTEQEKETTMRVFTGLTMLDTIQSRFGAYLLMKDATTLFEEAVYSNLIFMEAIHAKSYSNIFSTLANTDRIDKAFRWSEENDPLLKKAEIILSYYQEEEDTEVNRLKRKVASVFLESFLFYSGFYWPLYLNGQGKLPNSADIIKLIIRDEAIHGYYIGGKFQENYNKLDEATQAEVKEWAYDLLIELYENETQYTQELYDNLGLTEDVKVFIRYNANKALQNLGFDALFEKEDVNPVVLNQLSTAGTENHDFFSGAGSSYVIASTEVLSDDDWDEF